jgi:hypothetical protein
MGRLAMYADNIMLLASVTDHQREHAWLLLYK